MARRQERPRVGRTLHAAATEIVVHRLEAAGLRSVVLPWRSGRATANLAANPPELLENMATRMANEAEADRHDAIESWGRGSFDLPFAYSPNDPNAYPEWEEVVEAFAERVGQFSARADFGHLLRAFTPSPISSDEMRRNAAMESWINGERSAASLLAAELPFDMHTQALRLRSADSRVVERLRRQAVVANVLPQRISATFTSAVERGRDAALVVIDDVVRTAPRLPRLAGAGAHIQRIGDRELPPHESARTPGDALLWATVEHLLDMRDRQVASADLSRAAMLSTDAWRQAFETTVAGDQAREEFGDDLPTVILSATALSAPAYGSLGD